MDTTETHITMSKAKKKKIYTTSVYFIFLFLSLFFYLQIFIWYSRLDLPLIDINQNILYLVKHILINAPTQHSIQQETNLCVVWKIKWCILVGGGGGVTLIYAYHSLCTEGDRRGELSRKTGDTVGTTLGVAERGRRHALTGWLKFKKKSCCHAKVCKWMVKKKKIVLSISSFFVFCFLLKCRF